jgi:aspartate/tyrosine/aromatic aminotransferase
MFFEKLSEAAPDPIFGLLGAFTGDPRKEKVNLMVGIYKDDQLRSDPLHSVKRAEEELPEMMADYLPIDGLSELGELLGAVLFGDEGWKEASHRIYAAHTTGGTGALRAGAEFLVSEMSERFCVPNQTWPTHRLIFGQAGAHVDMYPYYTKAKKGFDVESMVGFLETLPEKTVVLLHACCHNPTGCDPTSADWKEISSVFKEKRLFPFFDCAYQGLGDGLDKDAEAIRLFLADGHEMAIAYSCSKNFSLYCQRTGALFIVGEDSSVKTRTASHVKRIIRALYSNPPAYGAQIAAKVLKSEELKNLWLKDLDGMRRRLNVMRDTLIQRLNARSKRQKFDFLRNHKGMFSFIDLTKEEVQKMIEKYGIYMTDNGRISVAGLSMKNIDYVVSSLLNVCEEP